MVETKGEAKTINHNPETNQTAAIDWTEPIEAPGRGRELKRRHGDGRAAAVIAMLGTS
jgi:hypothetical protein